MINGRILIRKSRTRGVKGGREGGRGCKHPIFSEQKNVANISIYRYTTCPKLWKTHSF